MSTLAVPWLKSSHSGLEENPGSGDVLVEMVRRLRSVAHLSMFEDRGW
jgi:hypothetical protein